MQGLHRGAAGVPRRRVDARREQREEIVDVDHVRPEAARRRHHPGDALGRMRRRDRGPQAGRGRNRSPRCRGTPPRPRSPPFEGGEVAGHGGILAAADLVAVMGDEDAQRGRAGAHRRPPPVFATRQTWGGRPTRRPLRFLVRPDSCRETGGHFCATCRASPDPAADPGRIGRSGSCWSSPLPPRSPRPADPLRTVYRSPRRAGPIRAEIIRPGPFVLRCNAKRRQAE